MFDTDSYKTSMHLQYPSNTSKVFSHLLSRSEGEEIVFFGLTSYLSTMLERFYQDDVCLIEKHTPNPITSKLKGLFLNNKNELPLRIHAVPEGTVVPSGNVLLTIENTDPEAYWLPTYMETGILRAIWYGSTVATNGLKIKKLLLSYLRKSGTPEHIDFKLHDFGSRGVSSHESSILGGMAHLLNFKGTDNLPALAGVHKLYNLPIDEVAGFSIPASEHSTMTAYGEHDEVGAYRNMIQKFGELDMFSVVSDSYDVFNACENIWGDVLKQEVLDMNATLVIRLDSGDPEQTVKRVITILADKFGFTLNRKGYKVLNKVRLLQGDGVNYNSIDKILSTLDSLGFSSDNISFGMGGALLQGVNRDDYKFAMKCSAVEVDGEWRDVFKRPSGDKSKHSRGGRLILSKINNEYKTVLLGDAPSLLSLAFDGVPTQQYARMNGFQDIRNRISQAL